jgi:hypothetical protein
MNVHERLLLFEEMLSCLREIQGYRGYSKYLDPSSTLANPVYIEKIEVSPHPRAIELARRIDVIVDKLEGINDVK